MATPAKATADTSAVAPHLNFLVRAIVKAYQNSPRGARRPALKACGNRQGPTADADDREGAIDCRQRLVVLVQRRIRHVDHVARLHTELLRTRVLEPLPEHLGALGKAVLEAKADFGVALDPDADRAAFVAADGKPLGEEFTVALGTQVVLAVHKGPVVTNLSTSRMLDRVCQDAGVALHRTPVGEAHVVAAIHAVGAIAGGEGNGGMILPAAHCGRDGLVAVALIAQAMSRGATLRELATGLPQYAMVKDKLARPDEPWERAADRLRSVFADWELDTVDGMRFARGEEWVHVRPSGTEPVVRVIAETPALVRTREIVEVARKAVEA